MNTFLLELHIVITINFKSKFNTTETRTIFRCLAKTIGIYYYPNYPEFFLSPRFPRPQDRLAYRAFPPFL